MNDKQKKHWLLATILMLLLCAGVPWAVMRAATGQDQKSTVPLSEDQILQELHGKLWTSERAEQEAKKRGIAFEVTPAVERALTMAGATDHLIQTLRQLHSQASKSDLTKEKPGIDKRQSQAVVLSSATQDKILKYIRERFGVADTVKLTMGPLQPSPIAPDFNHAAVAVDDGKNQHVQDVLVSKDGRYLIVVLGSIIDLHQAFSVAEMQQRIQENFKTPPNLKVTVGGFKLSPSLDFKEGTLTMDDGKVPKQDRPLLLSRDGKHLIVSEMYNLTVDPKQQALHLIKLQDEASQGPPTAPVTIVEYADLECPTCARMNEFLETQVVPRYGKKVRIVFKEYPLPMHDWSMTAAIADQCAWELDPSTYVPLRTAIFRNQQLINVTNVRETVLTYGEQAGLSRVKLAGCLDAKSSYPRIQRDVAEAKRIDVNQTPTLYINGRMLIGLTSEDAYFQVIDAALNGK